MRLFKDGLETQRVGDSENPMKQNCSQLGEHGQLNRTIDWPLVPNMKNPAGTTVKELHLHKADSVQRWLDPNWMHIQKLSITQSRLSFLWITSNQRCQ